MRPHNQKGRPLGCPLPLYAARSRRQHMTPAVVAAYAVVCDGCLVSSSALSNLSQCHYSTSESALLCTLCLSAIFLQPLEFWRPSPVYLKYSLLSTYSQIFSHKNASHSVLLMTGVFLFLAIPRDGSDGLIIDVVRLALRVVVFFLDFRLRLSIDESLDE